MIKKIDFENGYIICNSADKSTLRILGINERKNMKKIKREQGDKEFSDRLFFLNCETLKILANIFIDQGNKEVCKVLENAESELDIIVLMDEIIGRKLFAFVSKTKKYISINYGDNDFVFDNLGNCFAVDSDGYYIDENEEMYMVEEKREKERREFLKNQKK